MTINGQQWNSFELIKAFFPLRLLHAHLKYNLFLLIFWAFFVLIVSDRFGYAFGVPLLFLSPEYLGNVSPWSFYLVGFAFGGFIMAFNTYSYIKLGPYFPFLTSLSRPFFKFCLNNAIIPLFFMGFYIIRVIKFQLDQELAVGSEVFFYIIAIVLGMISFFILSIFYFFPVAWRQQRRSNRKDSEPKPISSAFHRKDEEWYEVYETEKERTFFYFGKGLKLHQSRSVKHLDRMVIERTFAKNRINSSLFEIITISSFFVLGLFSKSDLLKIPAATSIILLMTIVLMLFSALQSWFRRWVYLLLLLILFGMNYLSTKTRMFNYLNYAYGLSYEHTERDDYTIERINQIANNDELNQATLAEYIKTLEHWKAHTGQTKPKLIIVNTSGGGSRSALWTLTVLQKCDQQLNGNLAKHIQMITGASGGMIGAAYFRELLLQKKQGKIDDYRDQQYRTNIGKDMLNRLSFMATTNDIFIRYQHFKYNNRHYTMDRGYAFEAQLHENTDYAMEHTLGYYKEFEQSAAIPTMIFSPTIVNDGRRMIISSQRMNFLTENHGGPARMTQSNENIEFHSLLGSQNASQIRFSSVLRTSATFPFVMPMVTIPTTPEVQLMDAGIRDNYGGKTTMEYLHVLQNWITENTSGVIILQVRDTKKVLEGEAYSRVSFIDKITMPFGNMYKNFPRVQDFDQEELFKVSSRGFPFPIDIITFNLRERKDDRISLSWHLTKNEKLKIEKALDSKLNQEALKQLTRIL